MESVFFAEAFVQSKFDQKDAFELADCVPGWVTAAGFVLSSDLWSTDVEQFVGWWRHRSEGRCHAGKL